VARLAGFAHLFAARTWNDPDDSDCWFPYCKWVLMDRCPDSGVGDNPCIQVGSQEGQDMVNALYSDATDRAHLLVDLADWYFIPPPSLIPCGEVIRWRNTYCADPLTALDFERDLVVRVLGVESDWTQFFWNLTRGADAWTVSQFFALQRAACAERICAPGEPWSAECEPQKCYATHEHSFGAWELYEQLIASPPATMGLTDLQWRMLDDTGDEYGVSMDLSPLP
jgi:hypothetical protein